MADDGSIEKVDELCDERLNENIIGNGALHDSLDMCHRRATGRDGGKREISDVVGAGRENRHMGAVVAVDEVA